MMLMFPNIDDWISNMAQVIQSTKKHKNQKSGMTNKRPPLQAPSNWNAYLSKFAEP